MQGYLRKWKNYVSGWQKRWFVVDDQTGTLSCYDNHEESTVRAGCRGRWLLSDCNFIVHAGAVSFQILFPTGSGSQMQRIHLRAASYKDRANWLKALGRAKVIRNQSSADSMPQPELQLPEYLTGSFGHEMRACLRRLNATNVSSSLNKHADALRAHCEVLVSEVELARRSFTARKGAGVVFLPPEIRERVTAVCNNCLATLRACADDADSISKPVYQLKRSSSAVLRKNPLPPARSRAFETLPSILKRLLSRIQPRKEERIEENKTVGVDAYLNASRTAAHLFDYFESATFAPVKMDFLRNISRLEKQQRQNLASTYGQLLESSPTELLAVTRCLEFISEFLRELLISTTVIGCESDAELDAWLVPDVDNEPGDDDDSSSVSNDEMEMVGGSSLTEIVEHAYNHTLARYHDWALKGLLQSEFKNLPEKTAFVRHLITGLPPKFGAARRKGPLRPVGVTDVRQLLFDADDCVASLENIVADVRAAFTDAGLAHRLDEPDEEI